LLLRQRAPAAHCALLVHRLKQSPVAALQVNGAHDAVVPARQVPAPSHWRGAIVPSPLQARGAHVVEAGHERQPPAPSHCPSRPQLAAADAAH
jgi:hypothetical protein